MPAIASHVHLALFGEELKGDFKLALAAAETQYSEAITDANPLRRADAALVCGRIRLLQGEPLATLELCREAQQFARDDSDCHLLAFAAKAPLRPPPYRLHRPIYGA